MSRQSSPSTSTVPKDDPLGHAQERMKAIGLEIEKVVVISAGHGWNVTAKTGEIVSVYTTGKVVLGGTRTHALHLAFWGNEA